MEEVDGVVKGAVSCVDSVVFLPCLVQSVMVETIELLSQWLR